jgi:transcription-repair coupling factor (superfamily II helicase)
LCEGGLELDEGSLKPATTESLGSLLDYLAANALVVLDENADLDSAAAAYERRVPKDGPFYISWAEIRSRLTEQHITTIELTESPDIDAEHSDTPSLQHVTVGIDSLDAFCRIFARPPSPEIAMQARKEIFSQIKRWCERGYNVFAFCPTDGELDRFKELLAEFHIAALLRGPLIPVLGSISRGFVWDEVRLAVVSDTEIFCRSRLHRPRRTRIEQARSASVPVADFTELEEGDFVVHVQHGIGRYRGLQKITVAGQAQEALTVEYADEAKLYVPIDQAHLVSKYISAGRRIPELSTLGGRRWSKQKADAERAVLDLAAEMLEIQAARQSGKGFAFPADTSWQREFEASFIYEETPDQFRAIEDVKRDLESPQPMDRLICGDVGYGKTEVAIRAAFKAVMANKQVAILVPTTVLAEQHWNTFRDRMSGYPISVEMLSRFRSRAEQRAVVRGLAEGGVDIVIGTHRLLQGDIHFKDLGLVVIDEEQRFGVLHKEKFKRLRRLVEVLTLTATPIPRTLYLALTGARDMSQIETPPQDRLPVKTFVLQYDERTVTDAIRRELARGGQVYYLHNRVQSIEAVAQRVLHLVPDARIAIGHGQMHEDDLEDVMRQFVDGDIDVLVCTTIVESGLDIPNANTIIIDRADRFGLSDLYQLRGRVGRYKHQAYAYILLPRHMHLIETARKRIAAIKQYSSLGSGFKIAMRDLEIRGAGNILGPQQSGHIAAVGFDLYCQLLRESIARLKGEPVKKLPHVELQLDFLDLAVERVAADDGRSRARRKRRTWVEAVERRDLAPCYIPYDYISETPLRIEVYRKLAQAVSEEELKALRNELRDRFGTVPAPVNLLLEVATLRIAAAEAGIDLVESEDDKLKLSQRGMYYQREGRFPRLSAKTGKARLNEIKKLLKSLKTDAQ